MRINLVICRIREGSCVVQWKQHVPPTLNSRCHAQDTAQFPTQKPKYIVCLRPNSYTLGCVIHCRNFHHSFRICNSKVLHLSTHYEIWGSHSGVDRFRYPRMHTVPNSIYTTINLPDQYSLSLLTATTVCYKLGPTCKVSRLKMIDVSQTKCLLVTDVSEEPAASTFKIKSVQRLSVSSPSARTITYKYKVVQIWPGQTVTCLHTNRPGHIWTTLYKKNLIQLQWLEQTNRILVVNGSKHDRETAYTDTSTTT